MFVAVLVLAHFVAGDGTCASPLPKMGLGGVNLEQSYVDATLNVTRCCGACDALSACVGWTLNKLQSKCFLKSSASAPSHNANVISSGLKPAPSPAPTPPPVPPPPGAKNVLFVPVDGAPLASPPLLTLIALPLTQQRYRTTRWNCN